MRRLSRPVEQMRPHYDVIVVGSGYGGGIAASRLARAGRRVCVLERGREILPGEYPDTVGEVLREAQLDGPRGRIGRPTGLYDLRLNDDINVFLGCGLGGTSLVNANVSLPPEPRVFDDPRWPADFRADVGTRLAEGFARAAEMLRPVPYPDTFPRLAKLEALQASSAATGGVFARTPINVTFEDHVNHVGVDQQACVLCGDCVTGCNHGAKNTVLMNYLPDAVNHGADIFTEVAVSRVSRGSAGWTVHYRWLGSGRDVFDAPDLIVTADLVVLAAGTLGSTEILLRSKAHGLPCSDRVGHRFTGNGDVLAFSYNSDRPIDGVGFGAADPAGRRPVGPCITGVIDRRQQPDLGAGMVIEEGSVPGGLGPFLPAALAAAAGSFGRDTDTGDEAAEHLRIVESLLRGPHAGAVRNTQTYLVMTHDDAGGVMKLEDDRLRIEWPGVGDQPVFRAVDAQLEAATRPIGGTFLPNPAWSEALGKRLMTVHPLGGCAMAERAEDGVVDHKGRVFSGPAGSAVHDGLYVADGAVVPRSLGVNPLLTISAIAERTCALLAADRGWTIDYRLPSAPAGPAPEPRLGLRFTETMRGHWSPGDGADYEAAERQGRAQGCELSFTLTIVTRDLEAMLTQPDHRARTTGTVTAPVLSPDPLAVSDGTFQLMVRDPDRVGVRQMRYRMTLRATDGRVFGFSGFKDIRDNPGADIWKDTTTLYVTLRDGAGDAGPVLGRGVLHIRPDDFQRQLTTMEVLNAGSLGERLEAQVRFGRFFAGALQDVYGGVLARTFETLPRESVRKRRPLAMSAPEVYFVETADRTVLKLTRYRGGRKGPVVLAPGFGTSTLAYTIDTVDANLPEYLFASGYDVWLFDYRASPDLPSASTQFTVDDIARFDWPAAVGKVREVAGAADVQAMVHCVGSLSFLMAMMAGLEGVRSAVCSSLAFYPLSPTVNEVKAGLDLGSFLTVLGVETMTTDFDATDWRDRLLDAVLKLADRREPCDSAVCRRILLMYGEVYAHDQLDEATHRAIHEMFGVANLGTFNHLARMVRRRQIVDREGRDVYLPHLDRLAIPITFLHGARNRLFLPEGTRRTLQVLAQANDARLYQRVEFPAYAHMDLFIGRHAAADVYPEVVRQLDVHN
jgi:cholesterol oxidase